MPQINLLTMPALPPKGDIVKRPIPRHRGPWRAVLNLLQEGDGMSQADLVRALPTYTPQIIRTTLDFMQHTKMVMYKPDEKGVHVYIPNLGGSLETITQTQ